VKQRDWIILAALGFGLYYLWMRSRVLPAYGLTTGGLPGTPNAKPLPIVPMPPGLPSGSSLNATSDAALNAAFGLDANGNPILAGYDINGNPLDSNGNILPSSFIGPGFLALETGGTGMTFDSGLTDPNGDGLSANLASSPIPGLNA
jgi:hypothetical protein